MKVVTGEKDADASDSTAFDDLGFETSDEEFASRGAGNEIVLVAGTGATALPSAGEAPSPGSPYPDTRTDARMVIPGQGRASTVRVSPS